MLRIPKYRAALFTIPFLIYWLPSKLIGASNRVGRALIRLSVAFDLSQTKKSRNSTRKLDRHQTWNKATFITSNDSSQVMVLRTEKNVITILSPDRKLLMNVENALRPFVSRTALTAKN